MIVKILSRKKPDFKKLLEYMMNDKERLFDEEGKGFVITHNLYRNSVGEWVEQYKENEIHRINKRKNAVYLTHEILSWHKDDTAKISLGAMEDMAREYIELRNPNGLYIGIPHTDKEHYHVHFAVSALEFHNGKTMRLSKKEFALLKKRIQQYQQDKYPELSKSVVQHGSGKKKFQTANGR